QAAEGAGAWPRGKQGGARGTSRFRRNCPRQGERLDRPGAGRTGNFMDRIRIVGGKPLNGTIPISGAKNATLPLMTASLLTDDTLILDNVPRLADVNLLQRILSNHGVDMMVPGKRPGESQEFGHTIHIVASRIVDTTAPYDLVSKMRASFWVIAP